MIDNYLVEGFYKWDAIDPQVNIVIGKNGSGKSRLLSSIHQDVDESRQYHLPLNDPPAYTDAYDDYDSTLEDLWYRVNDGLSVDERESLMTIVQSLNLDVQWDLIADLEQHEVFMDLSNGIRWLLYMYFKTAVDKPKIALIDTPEAGLHIDLQVGLIDNLIKLSPHTQFFFVTHSPAIIKRGWSYKTINIDSINL